MTPTQRLHARRRHFRPLFIFMLIALAALFLTACGNDEPVEVAEMSPLATWTPTPYQSPTPVPPTATPVPPTPVPTDTPEPTATPMPIAAVIVEETALRAGPGDTYEQIGTVKQGGEFLLLGKDESGGWWQIRVNQQPVWVLAADVEVRHAEGVAVAQDIPEPPTATPIPPTDTPIPPTPRPTARPTNTPAPVAPDPCANIGGDGCKFRVVGGPAFAANGGSELRLTLAFVHGGRGDEAQGSYRVILFKNGTELPTKMCDASVTGSMNNGPNGPFNHDCKIGLDLLGGSVAGHYTGYVIDGNHERDSRDFAFDVPDGQGEVWIKFDQG